MLKKKNGQCIYPISLSSAPENILIENGRVLDPANSIDGIRYVALSGGKIVSVTETKPADFTPAKTIDARGQWVVPGLVDIHVHLREPGREDRETIETGTQAASAGGFTAVACMPNTTPVLDEESKIRYVVQRGECCTSRIYPIGSITKNLEGEELSPFGEMVKAGARAVSDDGKSVRKSSVMRNAFNYSKSFGIPVICHSDDADLVEGAHMNEGAMSTRLGIRGMPTVAEEIAVARDIMLAEYTGARVHIAHVSTKGAVQIIAEAKERGVAVTTETCPHYFILTDEALVNYDAHKKMNPPLRTEIDRLAIIQGLADGTIDAIATDHAPHVSEDKHGVEFEAAAFGVIGLETALGASITALVRSGIISPLSLIEKMSYNPSKIMRVDSGTLSPGSMADVTIINPDAYLAVDPSSFYSKSRNTAFEGMSFYGCATTTIMGGRIVYERVL